MCHVVPHGTPIASDAALQAVVPHLKAFSMSMQPVKSISTLMAPVAEEAAVPAPVATPAPAKSERYTFTTTRGVTFENVAVRRQTAARIAQLRCVAAGPESTNAILARKALKHRNLLAKKTAACC